jgi:hypothetical protein
MNSYNTNGPLHSDRDVARSFLQALGDDGLFTFQTFDDDAARKSRSLVRVLHGTFDDHCVGLEELNRGGAGIFVTVNRTDGKGRGRDNIVGVRALFVDLDGAPLAPVMRWALPPHIVVESSPSRYHVYWLVDRSVTVGDFGVLQKRLAKLFGGDPTVHDLPRVLRLPGFIHRKGEPFRTRILHQKPGVPRYSASEMSTALADVRVNETAPPSCRETPEIEPDQPGNIKAAIGYLTADAAPAIAFEYGNNRTYETACIVRGRFGLSELTCYDLLVEHFNPRCDPPWSLDELESIVAHAYRYAQGALGGESAEADFASDPLPPMSEVEMSANRLAYRSNRRITRRRTLRRHRALAFVRE